MSRQGGFTVYHTELYKSVKNMAGKQVPNLLTVKGVRTAIAWMLRCVGIIA